MNELAKILQTIEDLDKISGSDRAELIAGEIFMMSPASPTHSLVQSSLLRLLAKDKDPREHPNDPNRFWLIAEAWTMYDRYNAFLHDISGFYAKDLEKIPSKGPIKTRPFWVCEIMSPGNWSRDIQVKRVALENFKVPYYWIIDPERHSIQVLELKENAEHYQVLSYVDKELVKLPPFQHIDLNLAHVFA